MVKQLVVLSLCGFAALANVAGAQGSATSSPTHTLGLQGAPNFRDIGGYATTDGRHVRSGLVFRSNALNQLTPSDEALVGELHLKSVVDLRTQEEREKAPSVWLIRPPEVYESPKATLGPLTNSFVQDSTSGTSARHTMEAFYAQMPDQYRDEISVMAHDISRRQLPLLVHCTAGKDRTGVAIAVLLASLGVPRSTVVADYTLTDQVLPPAALAKQLSASASPIATLPADARVALLSADGAYITSALDSIDREYGSIDAYMRRGLGLSAKEFADLKRAMLE